ncbi:MAG: ribonuclease R [Clostridia bacterium]|nr:ribonuclease R [Clostridia bacterium]
MKEDLFEGTLVGNSKGFGFVSIEGYDDDFFIPPNKIKGALDGDRVLIKATNIGEHSNLAEVCKVLEQANTTIIGNLTYGLIGNYVVGDNPKLHKVVLIDNKSLNKANVGDKVIVNVLTQPNNDEALRGLVTEVLGPAADRSVLEKAILRQNKLPEIFPENVINSAEKIKQEVSASDIKNRVDLTNEIIYTIDGDDSKDLDDAISIEKMPDGNYKLGVHIADVGHYVRKGSDIDKEAFLRGTSAYFPGYVIPMLPTSLSNGICSLNEGEKRLTLSCVMIIDASGNVVSYKIFESVIKSFARLTYNKVYATLQGDETVGEKYLKLKDKFKIMEELCLILEDKRDRAGFLDLDIAETYFKLNEKGQLIEVCKRENNISHRIIETFMVCCNEVIAEEFYRKKIPFIYRVHETPPEEKVEVLLSFVESLGLKIVFSKVVAPKDYQKILKCSKGKLFEEVLKKVVLISLSKARYSELCLGHFGLASPYYTHFTSPIRRYSDLAIHRIIKDYLNGRLSSEAKDELKEFVEDASNQASITEKRAEVAERMVCSLKMAEYMQEHIGEEFDGAICGVTNFGVFVELENTIEGLIRIENLPDDQYTFDEKTMKLKGYKNSFGFGDKIKIRVVAVDLAKRQIEFCEAFTTYVPRQRNINNSKSLSRNTSKKQSNKRNLEGKSNLEHFKKYGRKPQKNK